MTAAAVASILSENLKWLMGQHKGKLDSTTKIAAATPTKNKISQRTVARAVAGKDKDGKPAVSTIETLSGIAEAFGVKPWELLHPDLPAIYAQAKLSLQETEKLQAIKAQAVDLSPAARARLQADLFGTSGVVQEVMHADPYPSAGLVSKGWSAAGKTVSRKTE